MADQPFLHIDDDWKKQAQEEKRRLAEQEQQRAAKAPPAAPAPQMTPGLAPEAPAPRARARGEAPQASFAAIVQSLWTQAMLYLGEIAPSGGEPVLNLDMARYQFDLLTILDTKTQGRLTPDEQHLLDAAIYETSSRFINVASQYI